MNKKPTKKAPVKKQVAKKTAVENTELMVVNQAVQPMTVESLIAEAVKKDSPLEVMRELIAMRRADEKERAKEEYFRALSDFQGECPVIGKKSSVNYESKKGGRVSYEYASMDEIIQVVRPLLQKHGFSYTLKTEQGKEFVRAICHSHHVSGHTEATAFEVPIDPDAYMNAAQKVASALTYSSRYAFKNAFGLVTGDSDDDAQILTPHETDQPKQPDPPKTPPKQPPPPPADDFHSRFISAGQLLLADCFDDVDREKAKPRMKEIKAAKDRKALEEFILIWTTEKEKRDNRSKEIAALAEAGFERVNKKLDSIGETNE